VDAVTQSSAEYHSMAFRAAPGAVVVGSTTAGADGNVSQIPLPGDLHTMISGIGVFYPDQRPTQRIGIVPDVIVEPTIADIRAGRDPVLEEALRLILGTRVPISTIARMYRDPRSEPPVP
jgi:C-terminal processing protease CtpA/Prc